MSDLSQHKDKDFEGKHILFHLENKLGNRSTNRIDEFTTHKTKTYGKITISTYFEG